MLDEAGQVIHAEDSARVQPTASIGKLFLLYAVADAAATGTLAMSDPVRRPTEAVHDSGLWQHLSVNELTIGDAAVLVASVSDNLAANALLDVIGSDAVDAAAEVLGCQRSRLIDRIRDVRTAEHPPAPSIGRADELAEAVRRIEVAARLTSPNSSAETNRVDVISSSSAAQVREWLRTGVDLSMAGAAFNLDPLAHGTPDRGLTLWNKTGTDSTVRADVGIVSGLRGWFAYAAMAEWDGASDERESALARTLSLGHHLHALVGNGR